MLVNLRRPPDAQIDTRRQARLGFVLAALLLAEISAILMYSAVHPSIAVAAAPQAAPVGNTETVGMLLYTDYVVPFEVASMLLLVAMVGAIVLARRDA
jgi:NADH-quinone oxidoreductase subunit J